MISRGHFVISGRDGEPDTVIRCGTDEQALTTRRAGPGVSRVRAQALRAGYQSVESTAEHRLPPWPSNRSDEDAAH